MTPHAAFLEGLALSRKVERCQREAYAETPEQRRARRLERQARAARQRYRDTAGGKA